MFFLSLFFCTIIASDVCIVSLYSYIGGTIQANNTFPKCGDYIYIQANADAGWFVNFISSNDVVVFKGFEQLVIMPIPIEHDTEIVVSFAFTPGICFPTVTSFGPGIAYFFLSNGIQIPNNDFYVPCGTNLTLIAQAYFGAYISSAIVNGNFDCSSVKKKAYCQKMFTVTQENTFSAVLFLYGL